MLVFRKPTLWGEKEAKRQDPGTGKGIKNIVIFGETGVGKSSLINLIAGERISETSNSAAGCTLQYKRHLLRLEGQYYAVWDTAGLDEGTHGSVPAEKAEAYLKQLLHDLIKMGGVDLLVYCVRGTRVRSALLTNYHLFYSAIFRKKVPIVIVVTGLENQEGNMDTWWLENEKQFSALQMHFDDYACVTTLDPPMENAILKERRTISKVKLIKVITNTCRTEQWVPIGRSWVETAFEDIRSILFPRDRHGTQSRIANVIMCDTSRSAPIRKQTMKRSLTFYNPITLSFSPSLAWRMNLRSPIAVMNEKSRSTLPFQDAMKCTPERLFRVYQVPPRQTALEHELEDMKKDTAIKRGADLLVFCVEKEGSEGKTVRSQWDHFHRVYGGDISPQIVIIMGARDQRSAEGWWRDVVGGAVGKPGEVVISYWPINESAAEVRVARERLRYLVNTWCIDCGKANFTGNNRIFSATRLSKSPTSLWIKPPAPEPSNLKEDVAIEEQDVLTRLGIWEHILKGR